MQIAYIGENTISRSAKIKIDQLLSKQINKIRVSICSIKITAFY